MTQAGVRMDVDAGWSFLERLRPSFFLFFLLDLDELVDLLALHSPQSA